MIGKKCICNGKIKYNRFEYVFAALKVLEMSHRYFQHIRLRCEVNIVFIVGGDQTWTGTMVSRVLGSRV